MATEAKKSMMKALRMTLCLKVSALSINEIAMILGSSINLLDFIREVVKNAASKATIPFEDSDKVRETVDSIIGNMEKCAKDLNEHVPEHVNVDRLREWDVQWRLQKSKGKRARDIDTHFFLSRKIRAEQARRALPLEERSLMMANTPAGCLDSTLHNMECSFSVGIPHQAIEIIDTIGHGSFGECHKIHIQGISFFPKGIFYVAKKYLGLAEVRFKSFEKEVSVDLMHNGIVRSIAHTRSVPWLAIFPFFNGGSIGSMLMTLPYEDGTYVRKMKKFQGGGKKIERGEKPVLTAEQMIRIRAFCANAPSLIHAIVQSIHFAHSQGVVHCDLHPGNVVLDFTPDYQPRIGVIDWGLVLMVNYEKRVSLTPDAKDIQLRPCLAPELLGAEDPNVYTKDVDVYALAWMFLEICTFCQEFNSCYNSEEIDWEASNEASQLQHISFILKSDYFVYSSRKSLEELNMKLHRMRLEPSKCMRPLIEMMPAFY